MSHAILYSFRRCPYAMRARIALDYLGRPLQLREVVLRDKPAPLLALSPKGTVPVLQLPDGRVLEESLDIMLWTLGESDPQYWWPRRAAAQRLTLDLIQRNDGAFKHWLDRYKYADRHPRSQQWYRAKAEPWLDRLESMLIHSGWLLGATFSLADAALLPFVRQFAMVDRPWFDGHYPALAQWLNRWMVSEPYGRIMTRFAPWQPGGAVTLWPNG
ncbi:glutathione S-transferase [Ferrimonas sediminicola]|uniref:Glutathione S-transferase n=1 Tax=Ferrimonas sediminicola TaxID=2569538 RepID=A0A4U1B9Y9_9GAMM|nr:glutathione S-transferase [Ferrimonas sediminicola]TKB47323.1 glutathione S-transferase [Ferrimonas sediminicola]